MATTPNPHEHPDDPAATPVAPGSLPPSAPEQETAPHTRPTEPQPTGATAVEKARAFENIRQAAKFFGVSMQETDWTQLGQRPRNRRTADDRRESARKAADTRKRNARKPPQT